MRLNIHVKMTSAQDTDHGRQRVDIDRHTGQTREEQKTQRCRGQHLQGGLWENSLKEKSLQSCFMFVSLYMSETLSAGLQDPVWTRIQSLLGTSDRFSDFGICQLDVSISFHGPIWLVWSNMWNKFEDNPPHQELKIKMEATTDNKYTLMTKQS